MKKIIITGGAGFIGTNLCYSALKRGYQVVIFDNLSRLGVDYSLQELQKRKHVEFVKGDVQDALAVYHLFRQHSDASAVFHLAGQVAVTTSVTDPRQDFYSNAVGSFNVLEAIRLLGLDIPVLYTSTNKVYGHLPNVKVTEEAERYSFTNFPHGIAEEFPVHFHSPYGCSKGTGDQYFLDYARIYGLKTIVFRQSCIYGPHQLGIEDQGWVAWFALCALNNLPLTIYGDGKQVRDVLYVDDLIEAYWRATDNIHATAGQVYNIGGGKYQLSLRQLIDLLQDQLSTTITVSHQPARLGDQRVFVSDTTKARQDFAWQPTTPPQHGITTLTNWIRHNRQLFIKAGIINEDLSNSRLGERLVSQKRAVPI